MTLFIQNDTNGDGTGTVFPNRAEADLFVISHQDLQLGEQSQPAPSDLIQVTYATPSETGTCPTRLHDLVTTDFTLVPAHPVDIIILAVDSSFLLVDGTSMAANGEAMGWSGSTLPGAFHNPSSSVLVVYDATPGGSCEKGLASGDYDLALSSSATLYHELSHARRIATEAVLSLAASGCAASPEERAAEVDGNDLRTQISLPLRDPDDHCAQPCSASSPSCCIVASIATGSRSAELTALRQLRDGFLRRSEVGHDFFARLHYDYYGFSPEVCRAMAGRPELVEDIATYYVRPLLASLELARARLLDGCGPASLGERFAAGIAPALRDAPPETVADAIRILTRAGTAATPSLPATPPGAASPFVRWALVDTIVLYLTAVHEYGTSVAPARIGARMARRLDRWAARLPITDIWSELSDYDCERELAFLAATLLRSSAARRDFGRRLRAEHAARPSLPRLLRDAGYVVEEAA
jgi:hypothetical protein